MQATPQNGIRLQIGKGTPMGNLSEHVVCTQNSKFRQSFVYNVVISQVGNSHPNLHEHSHTLISLHSHTSNIASQHFRPHEERSGLKIFDSERSPNCGVFIRDSFDLEIATKQSILAAGTKTLKNFSFRMWFSRLFSSRKAKQYSNSLILNSYLHLCLLLLLLPLLSCLGRRWSSAAASTDGRTGAGLKPQFRLELGDPARRVRPSVVAGFESWKQPLAKMQGKDCEHFNVMGLFRPRPSLRGDVLCTGLLLLCLINTFA
ncbi:hypothetical protein KSP40_PGU019836 [Platanthera guangdongensis]|uniref:Uncharacterized protein n=1 Tax=Platanthera guangdongensis TaxID=2320717 RepID=A0ABR2M9D3_9ASPA